MVRNYFFVAVHWHCCCDFSSIDSVHIMRNLPLPFIQTQFPSTKVVLLKVRRWWVNLIKLVYQTVYCLPHCFHNTSSYQCEPVTKQINLTSFLHSTYISPAEMLLLLLSWPHRSFCLGYREPSTSSSAFVVCLFTLQNTLIPAHSLQTIFLSIYQPITLFVCFLQTTWSTAPPAVHLAAFWRELHPPSGLLTWMLAACGSWV